MSSSNSGQNRSHKKRDPEPAAAPEEITETSVAVAEPETTTESAVETENTVQEVVEAPMAPANEPEVTLIELQSDLSALETARAEVARLEAKIKDNEAKISEARVRSFVITMTELGLDEATIERVVAAIPEPPAPPARQRRSRQSS